MFVDFDYVKKSFKGKRVVILGTAPSVLENNRKDIDKYDVIVRVNNYDLEKYQNSIGTRTDVHYSFYGKSVKKTKEELLKEGVYLCMCKCPDAKLFDHHKMVSFDKYNYGGDYRYIYKLRKFFWFCPTYIPEEEVLREQMKRIEGHMPTTGFAGILTIIGCAPKELYITGFDGFTSKKHNIDQAWHDKSHRVDPISHDPIREMRMIKKLARRHKFIRLDKTLESLVAEKISNYQNIISQYEKIYLEESDHGKLYGTSSEKLLSKISEWVLKANPRSILDYGCGRSGLVNYFWKDGGRQIAKYDPAIREYRIKPSGYYDLVLCTDVLEHIPEDHVPNILEDIKSISNKALFVISLIPARKTLPNGINAHLTVKSAFWWKERLKKHFVTVDVIAETLQEMWVKTW